MSDLPAIHQLLAGFADGDAISHEAVLLKSAFEAMGAKSEIYAIPDHVAPEVSSEWKPLRELRPAANDIVIHHYAIDSEATELFQSLESKKVLIYHNITPPDFFRGFDDALAERLASARERLKDVASACDAVWADSAFNASELASLGVEDVRVFHLPFSPEGLNIETEPRLLPKLTQPLKNIVFVGRIAPNKCIEELIMAFAWYHQSINRFSRLMIVGSERSAPRYFTMLRMLAGELDLPNVCFERFASQAGLAGYYQYADVFVSASRHEGFCLPLVEAMYKNTPVIARETGGTPEAMGGAGVMYDELGPRELAALIDRVISDASLRREVLDSQRKRIESVLSRDCRTEIRNLIEPLLG